jgi:hypothetical protein
LGKIGFRWRDPHWCGQHCEYRSKLMNYLAHALPFLDQPYLAAGTAVPDWLTVADRRCRLRLRQARAACWRATGPQAAIVAGIVQHILDDGQFHRTRAFVETSLELSQSVRRLLDGESGLRPAILGHLLTEVLLDAALAAENPQRLEAYYQALEAVDPLVIQLAVNSVSSRPTDRLAAMIQTFRHEAVLWDYLDDARLCHRINQVLRRVALEPLPAEFAELLPHARRQVASRADQLLAGIPVRR